MASKSASACARMLLSRLALLGIVLVLSVGAAMSNLDPVHSQGQTNSQPVVKIYVNDRGIGQWSPELRTGADFSRTSRPQGVFQLPHAAQFLIVQDAPIDQLASAMLLQRINESIKRDPSQNSFEIQLIEHLNVPTYLPDLPPWMYDARDAAVNFGAYAYTQVGQVVKHLESQGVRVEVYAFAASNGTRVLLKNADIIASYATLVRLADGRASLDEAIAGILAIGQDRIKIINTKGDWACIWCIADNNLVQKELLSIFPRLQTAWVVAPESSSLVPGKAHTAIFEPERLFWAAPNKSENLKPMTGWDIIGIPVPKYEQPIVPRIEPPSVPKYMPPIPPLISTPFVPKFMPPIATPYVPKFVPPIPPPIVPPYIPKYVPPMRP